MKKSASKKISVMLLLLVSLLLFTGCATAILSGLGKAEDVRNARLVTVPLDSLQIVPKGALVHIELLDGSTKEGFFLEYDNVRGVNQRATRFPGTEPAVWIPTDSLKTLTWFQVGSEAEKAGFIQGLSIDLALFLTYVLVNIGLGWVLMGYVNGLGG